MSVAGSMLAGAAFGLALAAPPGPMNAVIAEESVLGGWLAGVEAGLGAMVADACFLALAATGGLAVVSGAPRLRGGLLAVGGGLMLLFAAGALSSARSGQATPVEPTSVRRGFSKALALALTNPYQIAFWLTAGIGLLRPGTIDALAGLPGGAGLLVVDTGSPALVLGLFGGIAVWIVAFPAALVALGRRIERFVPAVAYLSAAVLVVFGVAFLREAAGLLGL